MKKLSLLLFTLLTLHFITHSQGCLPEGITFTTQTQIDSFQINYPNCTEIEGEVFIESLTGTEIINLNDLSVLTAINGNTWIQNNDQLINLEGLHNLETISGHLVIYNNNSLNCLTGLEKLSAIESSLKIANNNVLSDILSLINLNYIKYGIQIQSNDSLTSLSGLDNISSMTGGLYIINNHVLTTCDIQSICDYLLDPVGPVSIHYNNGGCSTAQAVKQRCGMYYPNGKTITTQEQIDNFPSNCTIIEGDLTIGVYTGTDITNLHGLSNLESVFGNVEITTNHELSDFQGLNNLSYIGGRFFIDYNSNLTSILHLNNLTSIGGTFRIGQNNKLKNLHGLDNLTSIAGPLSIIGNRSLSNLQGLNNLTNIGTYLSINDNDSLTSLNGLNNIEPASINSMYIYYNNLLSTCHISTVCEFLGSPDKYIDVHSNSSGCNSPEEVEAACDTVSVEEIHIEESFKISPNPCSGFANLQFKISDQGIVSCDLFEISGIKIKELLNEEKIPGEYELKIDLRDVPAGIYFCTLKTKNGIQTRKIIKL